MRVRIKEELLKDLIRLNKNIKQEQFIISANAYSSNVLAGFWLTMHPDEYPMPLDPLYIYRIVKAKVSDRDKCIFCPFKDVQKVLTHKDDTQFELDSDSYTIKKNNEIMKTNVSFEKSSLTIPDPDEEGVIEVIPGLFVWSFQKLLPTTINIIKKLF